jgi:hypothetical protein
VYRLLFLVIALIVCGSLYAWHFDFDGSGTSLLWGVAARVASGNRHGLGAVSLEPPLKAYPAV